MLLYGPPGCSKTLSAQAFATESGFNFFSIKGAELLNMYVGESERAMRNLFARAAAASPSIIFFDEIDSIAGQRGPGAGLSGGSSGGGGARSQSAVNLITTLLTEMDGFETLTGVLILAATNRPEAVDPALLRPGRFDQVVYVGPPDLATREAIFRVHLRRCALADGVDFAALAAVTDGHSGANIKHICAEAGLAVLNRVLEGGRPAEACIAMADLVDAIERTPRLITKEMVQAYEQWQRRFRPCG
jgi:AAA family ATPase